MFEHLAGGLGAAFSFWLRCWASSLLVVLMHRAAFFAGLIARSSPLDLSTSTAKACYFFAVVVGETSPPNDTHCVVSCPSRFTKV